MSARNYLDVSPDVSAALSEGRPVVALESTIITHGMDYPVNLEIARACEAAVRGAGAVPATIAIIDGRLKAGLDETQLEALASAGQGMAKASRRDMAALVADGASGGTTVATTMTIAHLAGIKVFATGGIGGVHRGAELSFDISADLEALATIPVAVVCAGAKSILDIGKTLEVLETHGVPVIGYRTDRFPAFYARESGHGVDYRYDEPEAVAEMLHTQWALGLNSGVVIGNPVPEGEALDGEEIEQVIAEAVREADANGVSRKDLTPFLLSQVVARSGGKSLAANTSLVRNNARLGGEIAAALNAIES
ncbi:pseudouridine-5'-phosphate glycosidase [Cucumibacter marinus]|uniref:pseudouridine-5'-phosphate glycosidase n=1 Tax=Cucumibacter marinus TaxID=1121252 RepID=UPI00040DF638|nr:pseudouridine-5'-phosphate glycosidase [Cucumibacter marinus]